MSNGTTSLLPCPFCGNPDPFDMRSDQTDKWRVWCGSCQSTQNWHFNRAKAIEDWNRRSTYKMIDVLEKPPEIDVQYLVYVAIPRRGYGGEFALMTFDGEEWTGSSNWRGEITHYKSLPKEPIGD